MLNYYDLLYIEELTDRKGSLLVFSNLHQVYINKSPTFFLNQLCICHGSTLQGRRVAAQKLLKISQMPPIMVCLYMNEIFFPTKSSNNPYCVWVQYDRIVKVEKYNGRQSKIFFDDGNSRIISAGVRSIKNQIARCKKYYAMLCSPLIGEEMRLSYE